MHALAGAYLVSLLFCACSFHEIIKQWTGSYLHTIVLDMVSIKLIVAQYVSVFPGKVILDLLIHCDYLIFHFSSPQAERICVFFFRPI